MEAVSRTYAGFARFGPEAVLALGAAVLALEPVLWLVRTWRDPSYASQGFVVFAACAALFAWSVTSPAAAAGGARARQAIAILCLTAVTRMAGQVLAINTLGALALVADVYAVALLAGLHRRRRAVSPCWLAVCFAFSLPLERILQRTVGYGLQHLSADGACALLHTLFGKVACHGVRIAVEGRDVLVDLPCSGARALLLILLFFALAASVVRPGPRAALVGLAVTLGTAFAANVLRITALAAGIALHGTHVNIDLMAEPWHSAVGYAALALGCLPVLVWAHAAHSFSPRTGYPAAPRPPRLAHKGRMWPFAVGFLVLTLMIVSLPRKALDVARHGIAIELPSRIEGHPAVPAALLPQETAYFTQYGGAAAKAEYGPLNLLIVRTSSPLRHLHAPDECLRGLGLKVTYKGMVYHPMPTGVYRAVTPDGTSFRISVTFVSDRGDTTSNVSEAVWRWLQQPHTVWTAVQRITPWDLPPGARTQLDRSVAASLDLPISFPDPNT